MSIDMVIENSELMLLFHGWHTGGAGLSDEYWYVINSFACLFDIS